MCLCQLGYGPAVTTLGRIPTPPRAAVRLIPAPATCGGHGDECARPSASGAPTSARGHLRGARRRVREAICVGRADECARPPASGADKRAGPPRQDRAGSRLGRLGPV
ncbi:hypothetical protein Asp14428_33880 [Actinoplanes sp. NBRC 14428]|nr:hypothetical protein Asp14428_33880 [Actinoplanes sp. NBRC 14428]